LTIQSKRDFESVYKTSEIGARDRRIALRVVFSDVPISNPWARA
jgi:hypothetical protein